MPIVSVEAGEVHRAEHLADVARVGDGRVRQPDAERHVRQVRHGAGDLLAIHSEGHDRRGHAEQRELLFQQLHEAALPAERPVIEKQQDWREAHGHRLRHQRQGPEADPCRVAAPRRAPGVAQIRQNRGDEEEGAQHVLALRHPGERFDAERMERPEQCAACRAPDACAKPAQEEEQPSGCDCMQEDAGEVMPGRVRAEQAGVHFVAEPGEGVPVERGYRCEGECHAAEGEAAYGGDVSEVQPVIEADEGVSGGRERR